MRDRAFATPSCPPTTETPPATATTETTAPVTDVTLFAASAMGAGIGASGLGRRTVGDAVGVGVTRPSSTDVRETVRDSATDSVWASPSEWVRGTDPLTLRLEVPDIAALTLLTPRVVRVTPLLAAETVRGTVVTVPTPEREWETIAVTEIDAALVAEGEAEGIDGEAEIVKVLPMVAVAVGSAIG